MSKGIIAVDIPISCEECSFEYERTYYNGTHKYCRVDKHMLTSYPDRSPQCPIIPAQTLEDYYKAQASKLTLSDTKEALKCCSVDNCDACPIEKVRHCMNVLATSALNMITKLEDQLWKD